MTAPTWGSLWWRIRLLLRITVKDLTRPFRFWWLRRRVAKRQRLARSYSGRISTTFPSVQEMRHALQQQGSRPLRPLTPDEQRLLECSRQAGPPPLSAPWFAQQGHFIHDEATDSWVPRNAKVTTASLHPADGTIVSGCGEGGG